MGVKRHGFYSEMCGYCLLLSAKRVMNVLPKTEGGTHMEISYNVTGAKRKELVKAIADTIGARAE